YYSEENTSRSDQRKTNSSTITPCSINSNNSLSTPTTEQQPAERIKSIKPSYTNPYGQLVPILCQCIGLHPIQITSSSYPTTNSPSKHIVCVCNPASKRPTSNPTSLIRPSQPNPNPVAQSQLAQNPVIANSQALMEQFSTSGSQVSQCHVGLRCGLWYKGQFTPGQAVIWTNQFVLWADPNSFNSLIKTLCKKFNGSIELVTARNKD
ncbi:hypothetical protein MJO28_007182, partial [Puccinia striiformis f. sp. tritici]